MRQALRPFLLIVFCAVSTGCNTASDEEQLAPGPLGIVDGPSLDAVRISVQYVLENPSAYVDKRITLAAQIVDVLSPRGFTVIGRQFPGNDALLVITSDAFSAADSRARVQGALVRVSGTVHTGGMGALERELGVEFSRAARSAARAQGPVFVAERVVLVK